MPLGASRHVGIHSEKSTVSVHAEWPQHALIRTNRSKLDEIWTSKPLTKTERTKNQETVTI